MPKPGFILPMAVTLAVLLSLYVGLYYLLVDQEFAWDGSEWHPTPYYGEHLPVDWSEKEKWGQRIAPFFAPLHWIDRRVRPQLWAGKWTGPKVS